MAIVPDPSEAGFENVNFFSTIGSAVYFEFAGTATFKSGDSFVFRSTETDPILKPLSQAFNGEYTVGSSVVTGGVTTIWSTCIATTNLDGI